MALKNSKELFDGIEVGTNVSLVTTMRYSFKTHEVFCIWKPIH
jgi:hypothetical protein